jgi:hypothetical protein
VLDLDEHRPPTVANPGALQVLRHTGPAPARLPGYRGPRMGYTPGSHRLELVVDDGSSLALSAELVSHRR